MRRLELPSIADQLDAVLRPPADLFPYVPRTTAPQGEKVVARPAPPPKANPRRRYDREAYRRRVQEMNAELARIRAERQR